MKHKAGALIFNGKQFMIVRSRGKDIFANPGGKYEEGETAEQCLRRELKEEIDVEMSSFRPYREYQVAQVDGQPMQLDLFIVEIFGEAKPSAEIEEIQWLSREDFENKKFTLPPSFYTYVPDLIKDNLL